MSRVFLLYSPSTGSGWRPESIEGWLNRFRMIKIKIKKGVVFNIIGPEFCTLARILYRIFQKYNIIPEVTSANDSKHLPDSWHYKDLAWDWRIWGVDDFKTPINEVQQAADELRHELQAVDFHYDVIYGDKDHLDHIHTEYDLKKEKPK